MVPGSKADEANFKILESMPVRCIITSPANGTRSPAGTKEIKLRGAAWAGDLDVQRVDVSIDFGATWRAAVLAPPRNRYDWRRWTATRAVAERRLLRDLGARDRRQPASRSRISPATGTRRATAPTRCIASPCWLDESASGMLNLATDTSRPVPPAGSGSRSRG